MQVIGTVVVQSPECLKTMEASGMFCNLLWVILHVHGGCWHPGRCTCNQKETQRVLLSDKGIPWAVIIPSCGHCNPPTDRAGETKIYERIKIMCTHSQPKLRIRYKMHSSPYYLYTISLHSFLPLHNNVLHLSLHYHGQFTLYHYTQISHVHTHRPFGICSLFYQN